MDGPIRVLHAVVNMNRGGAETLLMNLYRNVDRSKVQFDFLTSRPGVFDEEITEMGGTIHRIPHITDDGHLSYRKALNLFFESHNKYRIIHSHMDKMSGFILRAAHKAGVPIRIAHSHNTMSEGGYVARLYKWYIGTYITSSATDRLACSNAAARWLFADKVGKTQILHNGVECDRFEFNAVTRADMRAELGIGEATFVIGHVGRFLQQKNHAYLIERFAELQSGIKDSILLLAGDGPLRAEMEHKVNKLNIAHKVKFLGVRGDIDRLLQCFDAFVFPSFHEGLPVTLVEAQGAGLPCVISDTITSEVDMGLGLIDFFSLKDKKGCLEKIRAAINRGGTRLIPSDGLTKQGYNIRKTAHWVEEFYLSRTR